MYKPFSRKHPTLCFWLRREGCLTTVTLSNWQKQSPEVFFKKTALENFAIFTEKHLCWSFFFHKVSDFQGCNVKKEAPAQVLFCCEIFVRLCFEKHLKTAALKLTLRSDCLELCFWTVPFTTILTLYYYKNTSHFQTGVLGTIRCICRLYI